jgi:hypothetical protein
VTNWRRVGSLLVLIPGAWGSYFTIQAYGGPEHVPTYVKFGLGILLAVSLGALFYFQRQPR